MREFHAKDPEKSKLSTYSAIQRGPYSKYDMYGKYDSCKEYSTYGKYGIYTEYDTYGKYDSCKECSTYRKYSIYSEYDTYGKYRKYNSCKELQSYSTYRKYDTYSEYNKYGKTYDKVATADDQAPNPKRGGKGGIERCRKDTLSWFSTQGFFTGFIKAL
ncbi:MAG: hypothetical protein FRX48_07011 [Lasallia pustulata]|uniref:Uncharacterized protein n=1 Tax=Lasallia pustulata TaxID=136370 RepID=A0A5M8PJC2_9LECA|nr:MAG: hypothetical protein FRX48_07011 [Lasallia pustulata]